MNLQINVRSSGAVGQGEVVYTASSLIASEVEFDTDALMDAVARAAFEAGAYPYGVSAELWRTEQGASSGGATIIVEVLEQIQGAGWEVLFGLVVNEVRKWLTSDDEE